MVTILHAGFVGEHLRIWGERSIDAALPRGRAGKRQTIGEYFADVIVGGCIPSLSRWAPENVELRRSYALSVIPAKAGIQSFQRLTVLPDGSPLARG
jgi:hypothetical protein